MLILLLFYQLFAAYAIHLSKRPEKSSENRTATFNDYPDYDSNIWGSVPLTNSRPVTIEELDGGNKRLGIKRYPQLIRTPDMGVSNGDFNVQGNGFPDSSAFRPFNPLLMGTPRIRGRNPISPNVNRNQNNFYQGYTSSPMGYSYAGYIDRQARRFPIMMYTLVQCVPCQRAKHLLAVSYSDVAAHFLELVGDEDWQRQLQVDLIQITGQSTFPYIFICGQHIGGYSDLFGLHQSGQLRTMLNNCAPRK